MSFFLALLAIAGVGGMLISVEPEEDAGDQPPESL